MADEITWIDSIGLGTLSNGKPTPATRFGNWSPDVEPIGPAVVGLGTGRTHFFEFRRDDVVSFEIAAIPQTAANLTLAKRLKYHLMTGGVCFLTTGRPLGDEFVAWAVAPDSTPSIDFTDRELLEFTFSVKLKGLTDAEIGDDSFVPSFIPGLVFWHEPRFMEGDYEDEDYVGRLVDYSDSEAHADQITLVTQGQIMKDVINGHAVVEVETPQGNYTTPLIYNPMEAGTTIFTLFRSTAYRQTATLLQFESEPLTGFESDYRIQDFQESGFAFTGWNGVASGGLGGTNNARISESPDEWHVGCVSITSGRVATPYQDGVAGAGFTIGTHLNSTQKLKLLSGGGGGTMTGQIAACLVYRGVLSASERNRVTNYLMATYGIEAETTTALVNLEGFDWYAWLAADQEAYANNDPVTVVNDQGLRNHDAAQGTGAPTFKTNIVNSLPAFEFDGVNDYLVFDSGDFAGLTDFSIFAVVKSDSNTPLTPIGLWKLGTSGNASFHPNDGTFPNDYRVHDDAGSTLRRDLVHPGSVDLSTAHLWSFQSTEFNWRPWINDDLQSGPYNPNTPGIPSVVEIGRSVGPVYFKGYIAELLIGPALTFNDQKRVLAYLKAKYGIA